MAPLTISSAVQLLDVTSKNLCRLVPALYHATKLVFWLEGQPVPTSSSLLALPTGMRVKCLTLACQQRGQQQNAQTPLSLGLLSRHQTFKNTLPAPSLLHFSTLSTASPARGLPQGRSGFGGTGLLGTNIHSLDFPCPWGSSSWGSIRLLSQSSSEDSDDDEEIAADEASEEELWQAELAGMGYTGALGQELLGVLEAQADELDASIHPHIRAQAQVYEELLGDVPRSTFFHGFYKRVLLGMKVETFRSNLQAMIDKLGLPFIDRVVRRLPMILILPADLVEANVEEVVRMLGPYVDVRTAELNQYMRRNSAWLQPRRPGSWKPGPLITPRRRARLDEHGAVTGYDLLFDEEPTLERGADMGAVLKEFEDLYPDFRKNYGALYQTFPVDMRREVVLRGVCRAPQALLKDKVKDGLARLQRCLGYSRPLAARALMKTSQLCIVSDRALLQRMAVLEEGCRMVGADWARVRSVVKLYHRVMTRRTLSTMEVFVCLEGLLQAHPPWREEVANIWSFGHWDHALNMGPTLMARMVYVLEELGGPGNVAKHVFSNRKQADSRNQFSRLSFIIMAPGIEWRRRLPGFDAWMDKYRLERMAKDMAPRAERAHAIVQQLLQAKGLGPLQGRMTRRPR